MSESDRRHWDARYMERGLARVGELGPPSSFAGLEDVFPTHGRALDLACGSGGAALWLGSRGMDVYGVDVSPVAIDLARQSLSGTALVERCRFECVDLDAGLPPGAPVDLLLCHLFRDPRLYPAMLHRLGPRGLLAIAVLSEVGAGPGRFRAPRGELLSAFAPLEILAQSEAEGVAWLLGRQRGARE